MKMLCNLGIHIVYLHGTEQGKETHVNECRIYESCECGKKKKYDFGGQWVHDNDLLGFGTK